MKNVFTRREAELLDRAETAEARAKELEAQSAAMRAALGTISGCTNGCQSCVEEAFDALSGNAGCALEIEMKECSEVRAKLAVDLAKQEDKCRELEERTREFEAHEAQTHETMRECWSAIGVKEDAFHVMPAFIRNLQAHSAAMREALGDALKFIAVTPWPGNAPWTHDRLNRLFEAGQAALSSDAGRAMLERVEALEKVVVEVRRMEASFLLVHPDLVQSVVDLDALRALDAPESKR